MPTPGSCCLPSCFSCYENKANDAEDCGHRKLIPFEINDKISVCGSWVPWVSNGVAYDTESLNCITTEMCK